MNIARHYLFISILCGYHYGAVHAQLSRALYEFKNALTNLSQRLQQPRTSRYQPTPPPVSIQQERPRQNAPSRSDTIIQPEQPPQPKIVIPETGQQQTTNTDIQSAIKLDNTLLETENYYINAMNNRLQRIAKRVVADVPQDIYDMAAGIGSAPQQGDTNYVNITQLTKGGTQAGAASRISGLMQNKTQIQRIVQPQNNGFSIKVGNTNVNLPKKAIEYFNVFQAQLDLNEENTTFKAGTLIRSEDAPLVSYLANELTQPLTQKSKNQESEDEAYQEIMEKLASVSDTDVAQLYTIADFFGAEPLSQLIFKELLNRLIEATRGKNATTVQFNALIDALSASSIPEALKIDLVLQADKELENQGAPGRGFDFKSGLPKSMDFYNNVLAVGRQDLKVYAVKNNALSVLGQTRFKEDEQNSIRATFSTEQSLNPFDSFFSSYNYVNFVKIINSGNTGDYIFAGVDRSNLPITAPNLYRKLYKDSNLNLYRAMPLGNSWWGPIIKLSKADTSIKSTVQAPINNVDLKECTYFDINRQGSIIIFGNKTKIRILSQSSLKNNKTTTLEENELKSISTAALSDDGKLLIIAGHSKIENIATAIVYEVTDGDVINLKEKAAIPLEKKEKNVRQWSQTITQIKISPDGSKCAVLTGNAIHICSIRGELKKIQTLRGMLSASAISFWRDNEIAVASMGVEPVGTAGTHIRFFGKLSIYPIISKLNNISSFNQAIEQFKNRQNIPLSQKK